MNNPNYYKDEVVHIRMSVFQSRKNYGTELISIKFETKILYVLGSVIGPYWCRFLFPDVYNRDALLVTSVGYILW